MKRLFILCLLLCLASVLFVQEEGSEFNTVNSRYYWAEGVSVGTSFAAPFLAFTVHKTFSPFTKKGGWYIGAGGGVMIAKYIFPEGDVSTNTPAFNVIAGVNFFDFLNVCYAFRTNIKTVSHKVSVGYVHRQNSK